MLEHLHLVALLKERKHITLRRIPLVAELQAMLTEKWQRQLDDFLLEAQEIDFDPGYTPEAHERFRLEDFALPEVVAAEHSDSVRHLEPIDMQGAEPSQIKAILGFARQDDGSEVLLIQSFSKSHIINPGQFLFFNRNNFESSETPALSLSDHLTAVYYPAQQKLLFRNYRVANTIFNLADFYKEATEDDIKAILAHGKLAPVNVDAIAKGASQWFCKRFALLKDSEILDQYTVAQIINHSNGYDLDIQIDVTTGQDRIVFPAEKAPAKKLLQFLNEELFRGAITERLFETNSKRIAG
ncbi:Kiwa anti-phage protein KwaB-like domain-containing protein [Stutzerimonas zhaodongensis]|jgi:hypothetical protein|uniref:DUF4868 domain-containing protein n=1 Tax=Stutzerimonas zhaodongensis TaxID=1176257 RepID=A0A365PPK5_9GAMM|nr:Kiwa anti-phage protein KwaB-like domain-containing protein [Stutzerimonas zhaodongensis]QWV17925.1 DUF4868 domain-containing protein [Stutzerimonas zhaodongensis]RBA52660.1 hypothetical protein DQ403_20445 [Stutzerimonas zhaodongensis]